jgi:hypothetical protein
MKVVSRSDLNQQLCLCCRRRRQRTDAVWSGAQCSLGNGELEGWCHGEELYCSHHPRHVPLPLRGIEIKKTYRVRWDITKFHPTKDEIWRGGFFSANVKLFFDCVNRVPSHFISSTSTSTFQAPLRMEGGGGRFACDIWVVYVRTLSKSTNDILCHVLSSHVGIALPSLSLSTTTSPYGMLRYSCSDLI